MRQAWLVARKEATELIRDGRLRLAVVLAVVLTAIAVAGGMVERGRAAAERQDAQQAERDRWLAQGDVNPHAAAHYGTFVFRPVEPLAALDPGLLPFVGAAVFLEAHQQQLARYRPVDEATPLSRFRSLTVALCLQVLLPLLIVLLTYASVAGERERGTWRLLLAAGTTPAGLVVGKALGVAVPLVVVLAVPALGVVLLLGLSADGMDAQLVTRAAWMGAAYVAYAVTWLALGLTVSAASRSARRALAVLLAGWLGTCVLAPLVAMAMVERRHPVPSSTAFQAGIDQDRAARPGWDARVEAATERFLNGEELPPASNPEVVALIEAEEDDTAIFAAHFDRLAATFARQAEAYRWAGVVSPMVAVQSVSMGMAATDSAHARDFQDAAARYRDEVLGVLNRELAAFDSWKTFNAAGSRDLWARVPEFDYDTPPAAWALARQRPALVMLAAWLAAALAALGLAVRRGGAS